MEKKCENKIEMCKRITKRSIMIHEHLKGKHQSRWGSSTNDVAYKKKDEKSEAKMSVISNVDENCVLTLCI